MTKSSGDYINGKKPIWRKAHRPGPLGAENLWEEVRWALSRLSDPSLIGESKLAHHPQILALKASVLPKAEVLVEGRIVRRILDWACTLSIQLLKESPADVQAANYLEGMLQGKPVSQIAAEIGRDASTVHKRVSVRACRLVARIVWEILETPQKLDELTRISANPTHPHPNLR